MILNAFTRQEITAITPSASGEGWNRVRSRSDTQPYQYHAVVDATFRCVVAYQAANTGLPIHSLSEHIALCIEHSPAGRPLVLTLSSQDYEEHSQGNALLELLKQHLWSDRELIIHLDHSRDEAWRAIEMYKRLQRAGIPTMVNVGTRWDVAALNILIDAHSIRFNAAQLPKSVEQLLELAGTMGVQTLLTGISNMAQAEWAKNLGFSWLQVIQPNQT